MSRREEKKKPKKQNETVWESVGQRARRAEKGTEVVTGRERPGRIGA